MSSLLRLSEVGNSLEQVRNVASQVSFFLCQACSAFPKSETVWSKSETSQVKSAPSYFTLETRLGRLSRPLARIPGLGVCRWERGAGSSTLPVRRGHAI